MWIFYIYTECKTKIKILEGFASFPDEKKAPAIFMALPGEAREGIISRVDVDGVTVKIGIKNLLIELDIKCTY